MDWNELENLMEGITTFNPGNGRPPAIKKESIVWVNVKGKYYEIDKLFIIDEKDMFYIDELREDNPNIPSLSAGDAFFVIKET